MLSGPAAGYNSVFFMRADWQEIALRQNHTTTEMVWAPSPTLGLAGGATFAGILYGGYCTVPGLSRDFWSNDEPVRDSPYLEDNNVALIVNNTVATVMQALQVVPQGGPGSDGTKDIMLPLGCDFEWANAGAWYTNTDKLIHYLNLDGRVNAFYSTPSAYAAAKLSEAKAYSLKSFDLFPYDFFPHGYLTGFFTSRPALKHYIRATSALLLAAKQLQAFTGGAADLSRGNPLYLLERALAEAQHHDAVTGSSKQAVAYDYALRLARGRSSAAPLIAAALTRLAAPRAAPPPPQPLPWAPCDLANVTLCSALEALQPTAVNVYNSASAPRTMRLRLPVPLAPPAVQSYAVLDTDGVTLLAAQLLPLSEADVQLREGVHGYFAGGSGGGGGGGGGGAPLAPAQVCARNFAGNYSAGQAGQDRAGGALAGVAVAWGSAGPPSAGATAAAFTVLNLSPTSGASAWARAAGNLTGAALRNFTLAYFAADGAPMDAPTPGSDSGSMDAACACFSFADGRGGSSSAPTTQWRRAAPLPPPPQVSWLAFQVPAVPALGFKTVFVVPSASPSGAGAARLTAQSVVRHAASSGVGDGVSAAGALNLTNGLVTLTFDGTTGALTHYAGAARGAGAPPLSLPFTNRLFFYASSSATLTPLGPPSGAYIMRPNSTLPPQDIDAASGAPAPPALTLLDGPVLHEARLAHGGGWAAQTLRLWAGEGGGYEAEYTLGPIPVPGGEEAGGKEVCVEVGSPALATGGVFYTDSNHRDSMRRVYNARPDWNLSVEEPVAGNLYPAGGFLYALGGGGGNGTAGVGFSVLPDRAIGGGIVAPGSGTAVLLLHRRLKLDDNLGVGEVLSEPGLDYAGSGLAVLTRHTVLVHGAEEGGGAGARRDALVAAERPPLVHFLALGSGGGAPATPAAYAAALGTEWSALGAAAAPGAPPLPPQAELLTLHAWGPATLLLRLAHRFEAGEPGGAPVQASLGGLFNASASGVALVNCTEMTVTGNTPLAQAPQVTYRVEGGGAATLPVVPPPPQGASGTGQLTLAPLAIRTFLCQADLAGGGAPIVL